MIFEKLALSNRTAKNLGYTAAIAEAEGASEREAALACSEARCCFNSLGLEQ
jgi:hypothetical protein